MGVLYGPQTSECTSSNKLDVFDKLEKNGSLHCFANGRVLHDSEGLLEHCKSLTWILDNIQVGIWLKYMCQRECVEVVEAVEAVRAWIELIVFKNWYRPLLNYQEPMPLPGIGPSNKTYRR